MTVGLFAARGYNPPSESTTHPTGSDSVRINGLIMTALISLGVIVAYDKVKNSGGLRKGS